MLEQLREKWEEMKQGGGVREWVNQNAAAVTVGAVILLIVALVIIIQQGSGRDVGGGASREAWFYDVKSGEYFTASAQEMAPITNPATGNTAVRAHFYACGECTEEDRFVGYYEKLTDRLKAKYEQSREDMIMLYEQMAQGRLLCPPDKDPANPDNWVQVSSEKGFKIQQQPQNMCDSPSELVACMPEN